MLTYQATALPPAAKTAPRDCWAEQGLVFPAGMGTLLDPANCAGVCARSPSGQDWVTGTRTSCGTARPACSRPPGCPGGGCGRAWTRHHTGDLERVSAPDHPDHGGCRGPDGLAVRRSGLGLCRHVARADRNDEVDGRKAFSCCAPSGSLLTSYPVLVTGALAVALVDRPEQVLALALDPFRRLGHGGSLEAPRLLAPDYPCISLSSWRGAPAPLAG